jgi:hypothetical protein
LKDQGVVPQAVLIVCDALVLLPELLGHVVVQARDGEDLIQIALRI